jgi:hypothetical protein
MSNITPDSLNRQAEINDWYYKYRLDTLFILQLLFLGLSFIIFMSILAKYKLVSPVFVVYSAIIIAVLLFVVWYLKYKFNNETRDLYHWDKRKFSGDGKTSSSITPGVQQVITGILENCRK